LFGEALFDGIANSYQGSLRLAVKRRAHKWLRRCARVVDTIAHDARDKQAFAGHAQFVSTVMAVPLATATAYTAAMLDAAQARTATAALGLAQESDWKTTQTAALLQLEG